MYLPFFYNVLIYKSWYKSHLSHLFYLFSRIFLFSFLFLFFIKVYYFFFILYLESHSFLELNIHLCSLLNILWFPKYFRYMSLHSRIYFQYIVWSKAPAMYFYTIFYIQLISVYNFYIQILYTISIYKFYIQFLIYCEVSFIKY